VELCKQFSLLIHYGNSALNHFQQVPPPTNWFWPRPWTRQMMDCRPGTQLTPLPLSSPVRATIKCQVCWLILMPGWEPVLPEGKAGSICQMTTVLSGRRCLRGNSIFRGNYRAQWLMPTRYAICYITECILKKSYLMVMFGIPNRENSHDLHA